MGSGRSYTQPGPGKDPRGGSRKSKLIKIDNNTAVQLLLMTPMPLLPPWMMRGILAMQPEIGEVTRRKHYRWPAGRAS